MKYVRYVWIFFLALQSSLSAAWVVSSSSSSEWSAVDTARGESATLSIADGVDGAVTLTWRCAADNEEDPALASCTHVVGSTGWVWNSIVGDGFDVDFDANVNRWDGGLSFTFRWIYQQVDSTRLWRSWANTDYYVEPIAWVYDVTQGVWGYTTSYGQDYSAHWRYDLLLATWTHIESSSTWSYSHRTNVWSEVTTTGTTDLVMPSEALREQQYIRTLLHYFFAAGALKTGPTTELSFTSSGTVWSSSVATEDATLSYDASLSGMNMTYQNDGVNQLQQGTVSWSHDPLTGAWTWRRSIDPLWHEEWNYTVSANQWVDGQTGEAWSYNTNFKLWSLGSLSWQHNGITNRWVHNPGEYVWEYDESNGQWVYNPDGISWRFSYSFLDDTWTQITSHAGIWPTMPPLPVVQKAIIDSVYESLRVAGGFVQSGPFGWQTPTQTSGVWHVLNASGLEELQYNPVAVGQEVSWATTDEKEVWVYNAGTGGWWWQNNFDPDDTFLWSYDVVTHRWQRSGSDEYWTYNVSAMQWEKSDATHAWEYQISTGYWKHRQTAMEWAFSLANNTWTNVIDESVWRYDLHSQVWHIVSNYPEHMLSTYQMPPLPLVQQLLVRGALNHLRMAGAFSTSGPYGWTLSSLGDGVWSGDSSAGDERLTYDPTRASYMMVNSNHGDAAAMQGTQTWEYDINGDWLVSNVIDRSLPRSYSFVNGTGEWKDEYGIVRWRWYSTPTLRWQEVGTENTWVYNESANIWHDTQSDVDWSYSSTTGLWTHQSAGTSWRYDVMRDTWTQAAGVSGTTPTMPVLPVVQKAVFSDLFEVVARRGVFVSIAPLPISMTESGGVWRWARSGANASLTFNQALSGTDRLSWRTINNSRNWYFDPATGNWSWTSLYEDATTASYSYDATTKIWEQSGNSNTWRLEDGLIWRNQADTTLAWQYDPVSAQWKNVKTNARWGYYTFVGSHESDDLFVWTNITALNAWNYNEITHVWEQTAGHPDVTELPPEPVRQMTLIFTAWQGALRSGVLPAVGAFHWGVPLRLGDGTWESTGTASHAVYDSRRTDYHIIGNARTSDIVSWGQPFETYTYNMDGSWAVKNHANPFFSHDWSYDASIQKWQRQTYDGGAIWTFTPTTTTWTHDTTAESWRYVEGTWLDVDRNLAWTYAPSTNRWAVVGDDREWSFSAIKDMWEVVSGSGSVSRSLPPRVIVEYEMIVQMRQVFAQNQVFHEYPLMTWSAADYDWHAVGDKNNAQARYDVRRTAQLSWRDTHAQNTLSYNTITSDWTWRADDQHWWYKATEGLWGRDSRASASLWDYHVVSDVATWTDLVVAGHVWRQSAATTTTFQWTEHTSEEVWTYDAEAAVWTRSADGSEWCYNFATGNWVSADALRDASGVYPPLPLVQQMFINGLARSVTTFFDQPLYAAARTAPPVRHPLYGQRPLVKDRLYDRYNSSSVLLNADLTLDHVTWVHNDVSRTLGKFQTPSITETALPMFIGGERVLFQETSEVPKVRLFDSTLACHEPCISAGVRWCCVNRPLEGVAASALDAHTTSKIIGYNKGRLLDMPQGRGALFQLGSSANRTVDGTVPAVLRDAHLSVYRANETLGANTDEPTVIDLQLCSDQEQGVRAKEKAYQVLYLAHDSTCAIGWPTPLGDHGYAPWNFDTTLLSAQQAAGASSLFSAGLTGGGSLSIGGDNWYITARNGAGACPQYPVKYSGVPGVLYVQYGGMLRTLNACDVVFDTVVAKQVAREAYNNGVIAIPQDQFSCGQHGFVQFYGTDFSAVAQLSGPQSGHVIFNTTTPQVAIETTPQSQNLEKVK